MANGDRDITIGRDMDSTPTEKREMRVGVGRMAPLSIRLYFKGQANEARGVITRDRNRGRVQAVPRSTTHTADHMGFRRCAPSSAVVEGAEAGAPGCRTQTGHARRVSCGLLADGGSIPPASTI